MLSPLTGYRGHDALGKGNMAKSILKMAAAGLWTTPSQLDLWAKGNSANLSK